MKLTLSEAARQVGISKSTLSRFIKQGKISAERQANGEFRIDPSELDRVNDLRSSGRSAHRSEAGDEAVLRREVELLRELLLDKERTIQDLRTERDDWKKQAQTLLLTQRQPQESEKPRHWWQIGKKR